jgi:hypothetical protein
VAAVVVYITEALAVLAAQVVAVRGVTQTVLAIQALQILAAVAVAGVVHLHLGITEEPVAQVL